MRRDDTKRRIMDAALELFAAHGYDAVSVEQIAGAVGIKAPSLYNHFVSKRAILTKLSAMPPRGTKILRPCRACMLTMPMRTRASF